MIIYVDIDGTIKKYSPIVVSCTESTTGQMTVYPNPSSGSFQVILNNSDTIGNAEMTIVDTKGNKVLMRPIDIKTGFNMYAIDEDLAPGIYYISIENGIGSSTVLKLSIK